MAKRKEQPAEEGSPAWMATFSDLMNLLLCFFVLLFASSSVDEGKIQRIAASFEHVSFSVIQNGSVSMLNGNLFSGGVSQVANIQSLLKEAAESGDNKGEQNDVSSNTDAEPTTDLNEEEVESAYEKIGEEQSEEIYEEVNQMLESYNIDDEVSIDYTSQYVQLDLNGSILFDSGSEQVNESSIMFLQRIATILTKYRNCIIEIEGHTDNVPVDSSKYDDNRDLSTQRAKSVYDYIMSQGDFIDENMKISGYGESRPIASNATADGRARNRRVVIKIYNEQNSSE